MVCTLVCQMHLIRKCKTITGTFAYSNAAYHDVGNALNFKTTILKKSHVVAYVVF